MGISRKRKSIIILILALVTSLSFMFCFMQTNSVKASVTTSDTLKIRGASVRTEAPYGLRFHTTMDEETYNTYSKKANVIFGMLLIPEYLHEGELTLETSDVKDCITYQTDANGEISVNYWREIEFPKENENETDKEAKVYLYNIPSESFNSNVVARSYIKDGENIIYSSNTLTRSVAMVAKTLLDGGIYEDEDGILETFLLDYDVKFLDSDGTTVLGDAQSIKYGESFVAPESPTKDGFRFAGWKVRTGTKDGKAVWSEDYYDFTAENACVVTKNMQFKADFELVCLNIDLSNPAYVQKGIKTNFNSTTGDAFAEPTSKFGFDDVYCFGDQKYYTFMNPVLNNVTNTNYILFDIYLDIDTIKTYGIMLETYRPSNATNPGSAWHYDNDARFDSDMTVGVLDTEWAKMRFFNLDGSDWNAAFKTALKTWVTVQIQAKYDYSSKEASGARILLSSSDHNENSYIRNFRISSTPYGPVTASELQVSGFDSQKVYGEEEKIELSATALVGGQRITVLPKYTLKSGNALIFNSGKYDAYLLAGANDSVITASYGGATYDINIKGTGIIPKLNIFTKETDISSNIAFGADCAFTYQASAGPDETHQVANVAKYTITTASRQWATYFMPKANIGLPTTGFYMYMNIYIPSTQPAYAQGLWQIRGTPMDLWSGVNNDAKAANANYNHMPYQYYDDQGNPLTSGKLTAQYGKWLTLELYVDATVGVQPAFVNYGLSTDTEWYFANIYATESKLPSVPAITYVQ